MRTAGTAHRDRSRPLRSLLALLLALGMLAGALVLLGPGLLSGLRAGDGRLTWGAECVVETADGEVGLDREEAKRATTAVALAARGVEAPDTSSLDPAVLRKRLKLRGAAAATVVLTRTVTATVMIVVRRIPLSPDSV